MATGDHAMKTFGPPCPPYIHVHKKRSEIRLIDFSPSILDSKPAANEIIRLRSRVYSLNDLRRHDGTPFHAISYTWGELSLPRVPVEVNGTILYVTCNLETFLRRFPAKMTKPDHFLIWADALSIDQQNKSEKSWQVRLMRQIYEVATGVLIWLGDGNEATDHALDQMMVIVGQLKDQTAADGAIRREQNELTGHFSLSEIDVIWTLPWFTRVWIIQELAVSKAAAFLCGDKYIDACDMLQMLEAVLKRNKWLLDNPLQDNISCCIEFECDHVLCAERKAACIAELHHNLGSKDGGKITARPDLGAVNYILSLYDFYKTFKECKGKPADVELRRILGLPGLVYGCVLAGCKAVNPRDMIYPFLGLASDALTIDITPDYAATDQDIYVWVTVALLRKGIWRLLSLCGYTKQIFGLPSWVPDWTAELRMPLTMHEKTESYRLGCKDHFLYSASRGDWAPTFLPPSSYPRYLVLSALIFDDIAVLGQSPRQNVVVPGKQEMLEEFNEQFSRFCQNHGTAYRPDKLIDVIWQTPMLDVHVENNDDLNLRRADETLRSFYEGLEVAGWNGPGPGGRFGPALLYASRLARKIDSLRPFATAKGYIGMGPALIQEGDHVVIIIGMEAPMVLRHDSAHYEIVGEAYVHGIMDGEAIDDPDAVISEIVLK